MKVAVVGCGHGQLDLIYNALAGQNVDLLVVCGDFEACRNPLDLGCLAGPAKYHFLKDYWKYYKGDAVAPVLTLFVGGNHEASNHLWELYYGGWVAPNIYYLGHSGVVRVGDLRIAGISGIYDKHDYFKGHYERFPYNDSTVRTAYHTRECEIWKLKHLTGSVDAFVSHDWPLDIAKYGDTNYLYQHTRDLKPQVDSRTFGSPGSLELIQQLKPRLWLSGHMHVRYSAAFPHEDGQVTQFLAYSKAVPTIPVPQWMNIIDLPDKRPGELCYDEEWLAILRATHMPTFFQQLPKVPHAIDFENVKRYLPIIHERLAKRAGGSWVLVEQFVRSAPTNPLTAETAAFRLISDFTQNEQTLKFMTDIGLPFPHAYDDEKKPAEYVSLKCQNCRSDFKLPKEAVDFYVAKGQPPPSLCRACMKKK